MSSNFGFFDLHPKTVPADKLVFWHNKNIKEEGLCHEKEVYGRADFICAAAGGDGDLGCRSLPEDGYTVSVLPFLCSSLIHCDISC